MVSKLRICCTTTWLLLAVAMMVLGGVLIAVFATMIHNIITQSVALKQHTEAFKTWLEPPVPVYMQFWVFDLVNKDEVVENGSKPIVVERGPYTYREIRPKSNITFHPNDTLTYTQKKTYVFERSLSVGPENDTFTTTNLLYLTLAEKTRFWSHRWKWVVNEGFSMTKQHLFSSYTVHDLIWGLKIKALEELADIIHFFSPKTKIPYDIGLFAGINGTADGAYTIFTGQGDVNKINIIDNWKGERYLSYWRTKYCNMINGTDGTAYHPFIDKSDTLFIYSPDICRSIYVNYLEDVKLRGIRLYRFTPPANVLANHTVNPDNIGYCTPGCLGAGVLNISRCKDAPVVMSQPHFYQGAEEYVNAIEGMHPIPDQHRTALDVEPHTGMVLNADKRLQINVYIRNIPEYTDTSKMPNLTIFPVAWVNESASLDQASADKFRTQVLTPILITQIVQFGLIALGAAILLLVIVSIVCYVASTDRQSMIYVDLSTADKEEGSIQYDKLVADE